MKERKAPRKRKESLLPDPESEAWNRLPWRKLEQHCFRIQKRIYRASQRGKTRAVHKLQKLLLKSEAARLLAVRRVTQDNQGKKTAGVDGIKSVKPGERLVLAQTIHPTKWKHQAPKPVRRVWIPKPGKAEQRPLGIPPMMERCKQALVKMALEPEWEAKFEPNSYGFRPGRCPQDAVVAIFLAICGKPKFALDADISGAFDQINQEVLLEKLQTYSAIRQTAKAWLKAGVMDKGKFSATERGTPQGGVISPLLMNIALHGMEQAITEGYPKKAEQPKLIRYADDFVIFHSQREEILALTEKVTHWLARIGLVLNPKKTRVTHTLVSYEGQVGLDFLGVNIRQFHVGQTHSGKRSNGTPLGYKTIMKPSKEAIKRHMTDLGRLLRKRRSVSQEQLIEELNPIIRGWTAYYRTVITSLVFSRCDHLLWAQLLRWMKARHPNKGTQWMVQKYTQSQATRKWVFATPCGKQLWMHEKMTHRQHIKVRGSASPYDGKLLYWSQRLISHPMMHETKAKLLKKQQGKCRWCELSFKDGDLLETDHLDRDRKNNALSNKMLLHRHCHDERHAKFLDEKHINRLAHAGINIK